MTTFGTACGTACVDQYFTNSDCLTLNAAIGNFWQQPPSEKSANSLFYDWLEAGPFNDTATFASQRLPYNTNGFVVGLNQLFIFLASVQPWETILFVLTLGSISFGLGSFGSQYCKKRGKKKKEEGEDGRGRYVSHTYATLFRPPV